MRLLNSSLQEIGRLEEERADYAGTKASSEMEGWKIIVSIAEPSK